MSSELVIESGLQVITRLFDRPSIQDLDNDLFFNKLKNTDIVEIKGNILSAVTALLTKLIAKCILPLKYNGLGIEVLFINTENQFTVSDLYKVLQSKICNIDGPVNVDEIVKKVLNNLKIMNCYDHYQVLLTFNSLDNILLNNKKVGLIVIDSISAYYWQQKDGLSYDSYLMKMLNIIWKITREFRVVTLYTKQFNFESKQKTMVWHEGKKLLRYQICLSKNENSEKLICNVKSGTDKRQLNYEINEFYLTWVKQEK